ncbi:MULTISPECIES: GNAT family N-acetyltransferase [unclassified Streptomyces]|uniref:GNAT family N-acetyltransferase n=1 Tax=unclassified Streptomyces TaxID=2593676 RepID=UPI002252705F|nr:MULTISPECIES: GNAT family N-acetyltransferase [unclassified Streptomyces]MCX4871105.1 GNAT family N-acetyltransferase [Streptomyces sp. NBC_00906]MCX4902727.1 GNAT family N-acetyltransferase [Streptomyces sp. NBC_00892]
MPYTIEPASADDVTLLMSLRTEAEDWLSARGSDQWSDRETGTAAISKWRGAIEEGRTWLIRDAGRDLTLGTVSRGPADQDFWTVDDRPEAALYLYKLIVRRNAAGLGLGSLVIDWACRLAALEGREWVRLDCWRTATGLQRYYQSLGFEHVRTEAPAHRKSGWLGQRPSDLTLNEEALRPAAGGLKGVRYGA